MSERKPERSIDSERPPLKVLPCKPVVLGQRKSMIGLVTRPVTEGSPQHNPGIILMNAGLVHRVGPHRLNVKIARMLAGRGFTALRFDLSGFGDSGARDDNLPFDQAAAMDIQEAMGFMTSTWGMERFVLIGLCSGADISLQVAARDERVVGVVPIDSYAYATSLFLLSSYAQRLVDWESWKSLFSGRSDLWSALGGWLSSKFRRMSGRQSSEANFEEVEWEMPSKGEILEQIRTVLGRGHPLYFIYSGGPAYYCYLTHFRRDFKRFSSSAPLEIEHFPEADHTFTMMYNQKLLLDAIQSWIEDAFGTAEKSTRETWG